VTGDDAALLADARRARNGARFSALYDAGAWKGCGFPSQSEGDMWLVSRLMFWTEHDAARADSLFRTSALMRPKWERADYRARTFAMAAA
jgi:primase-polymerase (primpol)-like protein